MGSSWSHIVLRTIFMCLLVFLSGLAGLMVFDGPLSCDGTPIPTGNYSDGTTGPWTQVGSPYIVSGMVTVPAAQRLTIFPGVVVKFDQGGGIGMTVVGTLVVNGTISEPVNLTSNALTPASGDWDSITINGNSVLDYVNISYATQGIASTSSVSINDSFIEHCGDGVAIGGGSAWLRDTLVNDTTNGLTASSGSSVVFENSSVTNVGTTDISQTGTSQVTTLASAFNGGNVAVQAGSWLKVRNYLHIKTNFTGTQIPIPDVDVEVKDGDDVVYASSGYGGSDPQADALGLVEWVQVTDRIYDGSNVASENSTHINITDGNHTFSGPSYPTMIDMSSSHQEHFTAGDPWPPPTTNIASILSLPPEITSTFLVSYTAVDDVHGSGIDFVTLHVRQGGSGPYSAYPGTFTTSPILFDLSDISGPDGLYEFYIRATDLFGNQETAPSTNDTYTVVDTTPPVTSVDTLNPYFNTPTIEINFTGADPSPSWDGLSHVRLFVKPPGIGSFSQYGGMYTTSPIDFNSTSSEGDGLYEFYTVGSDMAGHTEDVPTVNDSYTVIDTHAPEFISWDHTDVKEDSTGPCSVSVSVLDSLSGINATPQIRYTTSGVSRIEWDQDYTPMTPLGGGDHGYDIMPPGGSWNNHSGGTLSWQVKVVDRATNQNESVISILTQELIDSTNDVPVVNLTAPITIEWLTGVVNITADASDEDGIIQKVDFQYSVDTIDGVNGTWSTCLGSPDFYAPFYLNWDTSSLIGTDPSVWVRARARDSNATYSVPISSMIKVDNDAPSIISWSTEPKDLCGNQTCSFTVSVDITDSGSGVDPTGPLFDYTIGSEEYDGYEAMTPNGTGRWSYTIPETLNWSNYGEETLKYKVMVSDVVGNTNTSQEQSEFIDPPSAENLPPFINHTVVTEAYLDEAIEITAIVTDDIQVISVDLHYKVVGEEEFTRSSMSGSGDLFAATIPAQSAETHVLYYIEVTDGTNFITHPLANPMTDPHSISIVSKGPPVIEHTPVVSALVDKTINISATVTGPRAILSVSLYYKEGTEETFSKISMKSGDDEYEGVIPARSTPTTVLYYIETTDGTFTITLPAEDPQGSPFSVDVVTTIVDSDGDGMSDEWESANGLDPLTNDADDDPDADGLSNLNEMLLGTDPNNLDSDGDGIPDGWEHEWNLDPNDENDAKVDLDRDGFSNYEEYMEGTDPTDKSDAPEGDGTSSLGSLTYIILIVLIVVMVIVFVILARIAKKPSSEEEEPVTGAAPRPPAAYQRPPLAGAPPSGGGWGQRSEVEPPSGREVVEEGSEPFTEVDATLWNGPHYGKCGICGNTIEASPDVDVARCDCGAVVHMECGQEEGSCPSCTNQLSLEDEELSGPNIGSFVAVTVDEINEVPPPKKRSIAFGYSPGGVPGEKIRDMLSDHISKGKPLNSMKLDDNFSPKGLDLAFPAPVFEKLLTHVRKGSQHGRDAFGFLSGEYLIHHDHAYGVVKQIIPLESAPSEVSTTFAQDGWDGFSDDPLIPIGTGIIIGWYRSESEGTYMGVVDLKMHEEMFGPDLKWALVVDPGALDARVYTIREGDAEEASWAVLKTKEKGSPRSGRQVY